MKTNCSTVAPTQPGNCFGREKSFKAFMQDYVLMFFLKFGVVLDERHQWTSRKGLKKELGNKFLLQVLSFLLEWVL